MYLVRSLVVYKEPLTLFVIAIIGYKEYLICHRLPTNQAKTDFKYSASEGDDARPVELMLHGANKRDPLHGVQRPMLKVVDNVIVGVDVCGERCERK